MDKEGKSKNVTKLKQGRKALVEGKRSLKVNYRSNKRKSSSKKILCEKDSEIAILKELIKKLKIK